MKKLTKKTLMAIFALVLAVVALGTTSYAWFTIGNTAKVDTFTLDVQGGEGLEVAYAKDGYVASELSYRAVLTSSDIFAGLVQDYGITGSAPADDFKAAFKLAAVTSVDGKAFTRLIGSTQSTLDLESIADLHDKDNGVLQFNLRFRTKAATEAGQESSTVKLIWDSYNLTSTGVQWAPEITFNNGHETVNKGTTGTYKAENAARMSITDANNVSTVSVFEKEGVVGENKKLSNGTIDWSTGAHYYWNQMTGLNLETKFNTGFGGGTDPYTAAATIHELGTGVEAATFGSKQGDGYRYAEITIRVYIEGFDNEAYNAILGDTLQVAFGFKFAIS
ncbi:MAG: hypothetical protein GX546_04410 [Acholeplasmataceae bacterium]|jgi:hypothetical protein|nr:hypothetical protein [Acholeplasmataceae bacterium]